MEHKEQIPLKWPEGWGRTLISDRKPRAAWKKQYVFYRESVVKELSRLGATAVTISRNDYQRERTDPGVAVWFSLKPAEDSSWQQGLHLDTPLPTMDQIDEAYKTLAFKHHPDQVANGSGGDEQMFLRLTDYRKKARAWVLGTNAPVLDNCIPCDRFIDQRQNLAAIASAVKHFRGLELVGIPAILERVMTTSFKAALPPVTGGANVAKTA